MKAYCAKLDKLHCEAEDRLLEIIRKHGTLPSYNELKQIRINNEYSISESPRLSAKVMLVSNEGYEYDLWDTFFSDWAIFEFLDTQVERYEKADIGIYTEEHRLAKEVERSLNNYSFDIRKFALSIPMMHPTLQQSFYRLLLECLKVMADDSRYYDDRNRASHEEAKGILEYLEATGRYMPHI